MARRRPPEPAQPCNGDGLMMPAALAIFRPEDWSSPRDHYAAQREWLRGHGIDDGDWSAVHPILCASKRAHARTIRELSAADRIWVSRDPDSAAEWWRGSGGHEARTDWWRAHGISPLGELPERRRARGADVSKFARAPKHRSADE